MKRHLALAGTCSLVLGAGTLTPSPADACGGLFCSNVPVNQAEEGIIFEVAEGGTEVTAIINIVYQGAAEEFAWVLPLQTAPESLDVGSSQAFLVAQQLTAPRFNITEVQDVGMCENVGFGRSFGEEVDLAAGGGPPTADNGVNVVSRDEVGPYDTVVLEGRDPASVQSWLVDNGFRVTDEMMEMVTPYLVQGDTLVALKLLNDKTVGEITPIEVKMRASEARPELDACIPIRMTAMAANTDMPITAYVFTDDGRAIPKNFFHVQPNLLKIDWLSGGSNYRELISQAVDEADAGHAFVTEYAGSPDIFEDRIYQAGAFDLTRFGGLTDLADFLGEIQAQGLNGRPGVRSILEARYPVIAERCNPGCQNDEFRGIVVEDPQGLIDEIEEKTIAPDRRAQALMSRRAYFTRLFTLLDPDEMTLDPQFSYRRDLEEVSNQHNAKMIRYCGLGGTPGSAGVQIILEDGRSIYYDTSLEPDLTVIDAMPAAQRIEQLEEDRLVADNSNAIGDLLQQHNARNDLAGCGCEETNRQRSAAVSFAAFVLLGFGLLVRRRRR